MSTSVLDPVARSWFEQRRRWTTPEFDEMVRTGLIREGSRTFLWDGEVIEPMPENAPHINASMNLLSLLMARLPNAEWTVNLDKPLVVRDGYKPQPDISVLKGPRAKFRSVTPQAGDAALLVEVSDTTYPDDSGDFLREYAGQGVPRYWIVNIPARRVEVYEAPRAPDAGTSIYQKRTDYGLDQSVPLVVGDGAAAFGEIAVIDVLRDSMERAEGAAQA